MRTERLIVEEVDRIPKDTIDGVLYVSWKREVAIHRCCCGCGLEVVTKLSPEAWHLTIDRGTPSLFPSIGNWGMPCQSHYIIRKGRVLWVSAMSPKEVEKARRREDRNRKVFNSLESEEEKQEWIARRDRAAREFWRRCTNSW